MFINYIWSRKRIISSNQVAIEKSLDGTTWVTEKIVNEISNMPIGFVIMLSPPESNVIINKRGDKSWLNQQGLLHREDGPAYIREDGTQEWFINGPRHRENGPALEHSSGRKSWYIFGTHIE